MLGRTLNLTRTTLSNFVRHNSHGGIPGEVSIRLINDFLSYVTALCIFLEFKPLWGLLDSYDLDLLLRFMLRHEIQVVWSTRSLLFVWKDTLFIMGLRLLVAE